MRFVYFAWVREIIGVEDEQLDPPASVDTVGALLDWLAARGDAHRTALADRRRIRVAVDQIIATPDSPIHGAREIAIFPPVTGG